jgi:hypothetical protein
VAPRATVKGQSINVRLGPGTNFSILAGAQGGQSFDVTGRNADSSWLRVCCFDGKQGWLSAALVTTDSNIKAVTVPADMPTAPNPTASVAQPATLTLADLPPGFIAMPPAQLAEMQQDMPADASVFGYQDLGRVYIVMGLLIPAATEADQQIMDAMLPGLVDLVAASVAGSTEPAELVGLDGIGDTRAGIKVITEMGVIPFALDVVGFRRADVIAIVMVLYPEADKQAPSTLDLARLLDERIMKSGR